MLFTLLIWQTLIHLLPPGFLKKPIPESVNDFRPISLTSVGLIFLLNFLQTDFRLRS